MAQVTADLAGGHSFTSQGSGKLKTPAAALGPLPVARSPKRLMPAGLLLLLALSPALQAASVADVGHLPRPAQGGSAVWAGDDVFFLGPSPNFGGSMILKVSAHTGSVTVVTDSAPGTIYYDYAFWDARDRPDAGCPGGCIYVPGTWTNGVTRTFTYNPTTNQTGFLNASHPTDAYGARGVWTGEEAYLFGGVNAGIISKPYIYRYDPVADAYTKMNATLPPSRDGFAAVWTGEAAYLLGGYGCPNSGPWDVCNEVLRYDPVADELSLAGHLPMGVTHGEAVWDGHRILLSGGANWWLDVLNRVIRYDPATGEGVTLTPRLPTPLYAHAAVWAGDAMLVLGGLQSSGHETDAITRYTLEPAAPPQADVFPLAIGSTLVAWHPPASDTYSILTGYRIYRADATDPVLAMLALDDPEWTLVGETNATTTSLIDTPPDPAGAYQYRVHAINAHRDQGPGTTTGQSVLVRTLA